MKRSKKTNKTKDYLKKAAGYLAFTYQMLFRSFKKFDKNFFLISLYDALFLVSSLAILMIGSSLLGKVVSRILPLTVDPLAMTGAQLSVLPKAILMLVIWVLFTFISIVAAQSVFKGLIWTTIMKKKFTSGYFKKAFWLNTLWSLIWIVTTAIVYYGAQARFKPYVQGLYFLLLFHFTTILYILFTRRNTVKKSIKYAFSLGVKKVGYFAVPYIYAIIFYLALSRLLRIFNPASKVGMAIVVVVTIFFIAWMRIYVHSVAEDAGI